MFRRWISLIGIPLVVLGLFILSTTRFKGEDLQGANQLLQKLNAIQNNQASPATKQDDVTHLIQDLKTFPEQSISLTSEESAKKWMALFDRAFALKDKTSQMGMYETEPLFKKVFNALPEPKSWPELQKLVEAREHLKQTDPRTQALLSIIVHTLNADEVKQWNDLAKMASSQSGSDPNQNFDLLLLGTRLSAIASHPDNVEKFWNQAFDSLEKVSSNLSPGPSFIDGSYFPIESDVSPGVELPDLVTLLGPVKAEPLLLRALLLPHVSIKTVHGLETQRLLRKLALAHLDAIQQPPWTLTESLEAAPLYEALQKKFPADGNAQKGAIYYVISLAAQGRSDEAAKAATNVSTTNLNYAVDKAIEAGWGMQVYDFLHTYLASHPENSMWQVYVELAAQTSHAQEALQFVQDTLARKDLSDAARAQVRPIVYAALLGVDKVDEGVSQLRLLIQTAKKDMPTDPQTITIPQLNWDIALARIGHVLKSASLETEGLDDARQTLQNLKGHLSAENNFRLQYAEGTLVSYLIETGQNVEAEKLLIEAIVENAKQAKDAVSPMSAYSSINQNDWNLIKLAQIYYNTGRWADILTLLQQVPGWNARDLVDIAEQKAGIAPYPSPCLGLMAARALAETGHAAQALPLLDYVLQVDAGDDAAYALLLKIGQGDLVAKLDALYHQDQFQERPLIWKGTLLLQQGKVAEAEQACKAAIAVDPSDGEEGKGDRMRVYSVMADVCDAKHDPQQATFFRNVVKAIRLSEDADDFYKAGLLTRAVGMYTQALNLFSDAYCIQSRIARQLAELGRMEEAAVHYRKAFELMPVSFGRMESHCFGCERAFKGKTAVEIAEKTFTDMLDKDPKKPQLYYLLGYLYSEEEHYPDALTHFQKAAELDPDYINAWKQIMEIGENYQLNPDLGDAAVFNILRLDPAGRHISPKTTDVRQLAKLWDAEETAGKAVVPAPKSLMALPASTSDMDAREAQIKKMMPNGLDTDMNTMIQEQITSYFQHKISDAINPRTAVLNNGVIATALYLFH